MTIKDIYTEKEIRSTFSTFVELHLQLQDEDSFVQQVLLQQKENYRIKCITEGEEVVACTGFRLMNILARGKLLYIDDLITKEKHRGKGYGEYLLDHVIGIAKESDCNEVHLDSSYTRYAAHKLYLNKGFQMHCHHFVLPLK